MVKINRELLFRFKYCEGMSNRSVVRLIENARMSQKETLDLSVFDLASLAELKKENLKFCHSFQSQDVEEMKKRAYSHQFVTILDEDYPLLLREIDNPPTVLFYKGDWSLTSTPCLSVVGSRDMSTLGGQSVHVLVAPLANDLTIVSGLATGIDGVAHKVAIANKGKTIGVIGCGLDVYYPRHHEPLQKYMEQNHLVISEYPFGTPPLRFHFPERNRIIAGLSMGVIVIEAKQRSGSLITCNLALDEGREVFAVPGDILSGRSTGCHELIQLGAKLTCKVEDVLEELR